jgi:hypothetical protein
MDYLEEAAAVLARARTYWEQAAIANPDNMRGEILDARLRIAKAYAKLAAVQRAGPCRCHDAEPEQE